MPSIKPTHTLSYWPDDPDKLLEGKNIVFNSIINPIYIPKLDEELIIFSYRYNLQDDAVKEYAVVCSVEDILLTTLHGISAEQNIQCLVKVLKVVEGVKGIQSFDEYKKLMENIYVVNS